VVVGIVVVGIVVVGKVLTWQLTFEIILKAGVNCLGYQQFLGHSEITLT
tara:strand:+ start:1409 stop:1555 length:147 start_codon:yes stop_codon:yes gene_type:complete